MAVEQGAGKTRVFQKTYLRSNLTARVGRKLIWNLVDILPHTEVNPTKILKFRL
jgi:hypothetical protein